MFKPKNQIAYIPTHAEGDIKHVDVEFGFVTSISKAKKSTSENYRVFCRYWRKGFPGQLRTFANSESTLSDMIVLHDSVPQEVANFAFDTIEEIRFKELKETLS